MSKKEQKLQLKDLSPKTDFIFKYLFGKKRNNAILKDLLEAILEKKISKVELDKDLELLPDAADKKIGILDVKAILDDGTIVNVEMQNYNSGNMIKRMSYYLSRLYSEQLGKNEHYEKLNKAISIGILNFNYFQDINDFHTKWKYTEQKYKEETLDEQEIHFIELPKFFKQKIDMDNKLHQWMVFLDYSRKELVKVAREKNEQVNEAQEEYEYLTGVAKLRRLAFLRRKYELDYNSGMAYAKETGLVEGRAEGRLERQKEIARKMLEENMDIELIEKITGLSKKEIEELK